MDSNQEFMILSLLNLYTSYVSLKNGASDSGKEPFHSRYATKQLQKFRTSSNELQAGNKNFSLVPKAAAYKEKEKPFVHTGLVEQNQSTIEPNTGDTIVNITIDREKEISSDNFNAFICSEPVTDTLINHTTIADIEDSIADKEKPKIVKRRRRRGKKNSEDSTEEIKIRKPRVRRWRVRPMNDDRVLTGYHRKVFSTVKQMGHQQFFEHTRMSKTLFDWLLTFVQSSIRKKKQSIFAEERLAITLNYLAYGTPLTSIAFKYKVGKSTARQIVLDTCGVLWNLLSPIYLSKLTTSQYADIAEDFKNKWDFPNCVGAIDGKLLSIRDPSKSAPLNNKPLISLPILGICDAKYKFSAISVGNFNNESDDGIFLLSSQNVITVSDNLPLPSCKPISPSSPPFPHFFISDTNFPLRKNIMRPYSETNLDVTKTIFNYKISRARTVTENTFGILFARFRVFLTTIEFLPENCKIIILACIVLHNFIMTNDEEQLYCPANFVDRQTETGIVEEGEWRTEIENNGDKPLLSMPPSNIRSTYEANNLRNTLAHLFARDAISYEVQIVSEN